MSTGWVSYRLFTSRESSSVNDNAVSFGQIMSIVLLIGPLIAVGARLMPLLSQTQSTNATQQSGAPEYATAYGENCEYLSKHNPFHLIHILMSRTDFVGIGRSSDSEEGVVWPGDIAMQPQAIIDRKRYPYTEILNTTSFYRRILICPGPPVLGIITFAMYTLMSSDSAVWLITGFWIWVLVCLPTSIYFLIYFTLLFSYHRSQCHQSRPFLRSLCDPGPALAMKLLCGFLLQAYVTVPFMFALFHDVDGYPKWDIDPLFFTTVTLSAAAGIQIFFWCIGVFFAGNQRCASRSNK
jgi:hypothetical protein